MPKNKCVGKKITETMYLHCRRSKYTDSGYAFSIYPFSCGEDPDEINLGKAVEFSMTVPDIDIDSLIIDKMRERQQELKANAQVAVNNIEETIQSMLYLSHQE